MYQYHKENPRCSFAISTNISKLCQSYKLLTLHNITHHTIFYSLPSKMSRPSSKRSNLEKYQILSQCAAGGDWGCCQCPDIQDRKHQYCSGCGHFVCTSCREMQYRPRETLAATAQPPTTTHAAQAIAPGSWKCCQCRDELGPHIHYCWCSHFLCPECTEAK